MPEMLCRKCRTPNEWRGGPPGTCRACGRELVPLSFEIGARIFIIAMFVVLLSLSKIPPSEVPADKLLAAFVIGCCLEMGDMLFTRFMRRRGVFGHPLIDLAIIIVLAVVLPLPRDFKICLFAPFLVLKWFGSPLALMPLLGKGDR